VLEQKVHTIGVGELNGIVERPLPGEFTFVVDRDLEILGEKLEHVQLPIAGADVDREMVHLGHGAARVSCPACDESFQGGQISDFAGIESLRLACGDGSAI
jgi:hypothetical protein